MHQKELVFSEYEHFILCFLKHLKKKLFNLTYLIAILYPEIPPLYNFTMYSMSDYLLCLMPKARKKGGCWHSMGSKMYPSKLAWHNTMDACTHVIFHSTVYSNTLIYLLSFIGTKLIWQEP